MIIGYFVEMLFLIMRERVSFVIFGYLCLDFSLYLLIFYVIFVKVIFISLDLD
jgi:hypothetical protein